MHPITSSLAALSSLSDSESSFPERHLEDLEHSSPAQWPSHEDVTRFSATSLDFTQATLPKLHTFQPRNSHFLLQNWAGQSQTLIHRSDIPTQPTPSEQSLLHSSFRQTTSPVQTEWDLFRATSEYSLGSIQWNPQSALSSLEDDSESIPSINDSPEEFCPPLSAWSGTHKIRRRSTHRITKPTRVTVGNTVSHGIVLDKRHLHDSSPDLLDFYETDLFSSQTNNDQIITPESATTTNFVIPDEDAAEKNHSKRIAHKLSEKTRRNRLTVAIREIQKLLPSESDIDGSSLADCDLLVRPGVPNSKLDVVEMAIGFIRRLKEENIEMGKKIKAYETAKKTAPDCRCLQEANGEKSANSDAQNPVAGELVEKAAK